MNIAASGLQAGYALVARGAGRIANAGTNRNGSFEHELVEGSVEIIAGRQQFEASAAVLKIEESMLGSLLRRKA